jgi:hypothetical protein
MAGKKPVIEGLDVGAFEDLQGSRASRRPPGTT